MDFLDDNSVKIRLLVMDIQVLLQWKTFIHMMFVAIQPRFITRHWRVETWMLRSCLDYY